MWFIYAHCSRTKLKGVDRSDPALLAPMQQQKPTTLIGPSTIACLQRKGARAKARNLIAPWLMHMPHDMMIQRGETGRRRRCMATIDWVHQLGTPDQIFPAPAQHLQK